jgi:hypothetical protein
VLRRGCIVNGTCILTVMKDGIGVDRVPKCEPGLESVSLSRIASVSQNVASIPDTQ